MLDISHKKISIIIVVLILVITATVFAVFVIKSKDGKKVSNQQIQEVRDSIESKETNIAENINTKNISNDSLPDVEDNPAQNENNENSSAQTNMATTISKEKIDCKLKVKGKNVNSVKLSWDCTNWVGWSCDIKYLDSYEAHTLKKSVQLPSGSAEVYSWTRVGDRPGPQPNTYELKCSSNDGRKGEFTVTYLNPY
jgi:hypothetical protein